MNPVFKVLRACLATEVEPHSRRLTSVQLLHAIGLIASNALHGISPLAGSHRSVFGRFTSFRDDFHNISLRPEVYSGLVAGLKSAHWIVSPRAKKDNFTRSKCVRTVSFGISTRLLQDGQ